MSSISSPVSSRHAPGASTPSIPTGPTRVRLAVCHSSAPRAAREFAPGGTSVARRDLHLRHLEPVREQIVRRSQPQRVRAVAAPVFLRRERLGERIADATRRRPVLGGSRVGGSVAACASVAESSAASVAASSAASSASLRATRRPRRRAVAGFVHASASGARSSSRRVEGDLRGRDGARKTRVGQSASPHGGDVGLRDAAGAKGEVERAGGGEHTRSPDVSASMRPTAPSEDRPGVEGTREELVRGRATERVARHAGGTRRSETCPRGLCTTRATTESGSSPSARGDRGAMTARRRPRKPRRHRRAAARGSARASRRRRRRNDDASRVSPPSAERRVWRARSASGGISHRYPPPRASPAHPPAALAALPHTPPRPLRARRLREPPPVLDRAPPALPLALKR